MKRAGHLWPQVIAFDNLYAAARQTRRGKRFTPAALEFEANIEQELLALETELTGKTYLPGDYRSFFIMEPKRRMISAAPYRDRVVHHALINVLGPIFERGFVTESFANRSGYGTHRALRRFTRLARSHRFILQCDIRKYFASIDHAILKGLIRRKIKCRDTLWLCDLIIDCANEQEAVDLFFPGDDLLTLIDRRRGLPVGNLTSQWFANLYLDGFDHFVKQQLRIPAYVRYVDDFALFADDHGLLQEARHQIESHLAGLRVQIHPIKSQLFETRAGASFLGFRVTPTALRVRGVSLRRARRRMHALQDDYAAGRIELDRVKQSMRSWIAHLEHGNTWRLREKMLHEFPFVQDRGA